MVIFAYFVYFLLLDPPSSRRERSFGGVSRLFHRRCEGLAKLRAVILDRAELARVLGTRIPPGVQGARGVAYDSRRVGPGFAFVAVPGFKRDGAEFAPDALRRGASLRGAT